MTERQEEQAALHALHLLDPHEERILVSEMKIDPRLRDLATELEDAAGTIALLIPEQPPPDGSRERLLIALKQRRRSNAKPFAAPLRMLASPWIAWAVAACLAVIAFRFRHASQALDRQAGTISQIESAAQSSAAKSREQIAVLDQKLAEASDRAAQLAGEVTRLQQANPLARMEPALLRTSLKRYDEVVALIVWDGEKQQGKLKVEKLPPAPANKDYQLWVFDKKKPATFISAGVVKVDSRGFAVATFQPADPVMEAFKFALSIEKQGGVPIKSADGSIIFTGP